MISHLPLILAGPILRRVDSDRVCVWIATSKKVNILMDILQRVNTNSNNLDDGTININKELVVGDNGENQNSHSISRSSRRRKELIQIGTGRNSYFQLGDCLFVNIIDAEPIHEKKTHFDSDTKLGFPKDELLFYDLDFEVENEQITAQYSLDDLGLLDGENSIIYPTSGSEIKSDSGESDALGFWSHSGNINLPSFFIPSRNSNSKLNVLYGSCRKLHGDDEDNLVIADRIISENFFDLRRRPSALFLIGDQIYADNVAGPIINHINDLSKKIMGWDEILAGLDHPLSSFKIGQREAKVKELTQFSSDDMDNHLLGLGEFAAMYLIAWNQEIWPNDLKIQSNNFIDSKGSEKYELELMHLNQSLNVLKNIRRLLANIPTYMICDDHEITDDWNINKKWYQSVCRSKAGNQVVANGLVAYWAFQAWGNDPAAFDDEFKDLIKSYVKRRELLSFRRFENEQAPLNSGKESLDNVYSGNIAIRNLEDQILNLKKWTFVAPTYPLSLFLDCRTQREFVDDEGPPLLLDEQALEIAKNELHKNGYKYGDPLVIVSPTPVLGFELAESVQRFLTTISGSYKWDLETWRANEDGFIKFLNFIHENFNPSFCVFLSGDVHYAFTMKGELVKYGPINEKAKLRNSYKDFPDAATAKLNQVIQKASVKNKACEIDTNFSKLCMVQLTSSPIKSTSTDNRFVAILILNLVHMMLISTRRVLINRCKFDYKRVYQRRFNKFVQTTDETKAASQIESTKESWYRPQYYSGHDDTHNNIFGKLSIIAKSLRTRYLSKRKSALLSTMPRIQEARLLLTPNFLLSSPVLSSNNIGQVYLDYSNKTVRHALHYTSDDKIINKKVDVGFY